VEVVSVSVTAVRRPKARNALSLAQNASRKFPKGEGPQRRLHHIPTVAQNLAPTVLPLGRQEPGAIFGQVVFAVALCKQSPSSIPKFDRVFYERILAVLAVVHWVLV